VVADVPDDSLLVAQAGEQWEQGRRTSRLSFLPLPGTWRSEMERAPETVARGALQDYLNPLQTGARLNEEPDRGITRVKDRPDVQLILPFAPRQEEG
jgi:hypothetical protein